MPPNILLFYCSNLWALTTSAPKFPPRLLLAPRISTPPTTSAPNCKRGGYKRARVPFSPHIRLVSQSSTAPTFSAPNCKRGVSITPQIKFGRILNNSRFGRLYGVFLRRRHSAFLQIAPISPPHRPLSKTLQPAFAAFCPLSKLRPFFAPYIFPAQISRLAKLHPFSHFSFVCKNQHFFTYRNFKGVFGFFIFAPAFSKNSTSFACAKNQALF